MLKFKFADVAEGLDSGKVLEIFVKEGDTVEEGDDLFSVETEKVTTEVTTPCDGEIKKILISPQEEIKVGQVVMHIDDGEGADEADTEVGSSQPEAEEKPPASVVGAITISDDVLPARRAPTTAPEYVNRDVRSTPVARKMAADLKIDLTKVKGSGDQGRILKADLEAFVAAQTEPQLPPQPQYVTPPSPQPGPPPPPPQAPPVRPVILPPLVGGQFQAGHEVELQSLSNIRQAISRAMTMSRTSIPEITLMREVNVDNLWALRKKLKDDAWARGVKLTFMGFFVKALALALTQFPNHNSVLDTKNNQLKIKKYFNIGIAVDAPQGLMVPVIKNADQKSVFIIAQEVATLAQKIRSNQISSSDLSDGTFTLTNYGSVGIEFATPVIKYPEAGIMGVGAIKRKPIVADDGEIKAGYILPVSLVVDHRIVDGAEAGRFLNAFIYLLEHPMALLI